MSWPTYSAYGAILAQGLTRSALDARLQDDPFVQRGVVSAEVFEASPTRVDPRLTSIRHRCEPHS
jgi:hypothetical protein